MNNSRPSDTPDTLRPGYYVCTPAQEGTWPCIYRLEEDGEWWTWNDQISRDADPRTLGLLRFLECAQDRIPPGDPLYDVISQNLDHPDTTTAKEEG